MHRTSLLLVTLLTPPAYMAIAAEAHPMRVWSRSAMSAAGAAALSQAAPARDTTQINSNVISPGGEFPKREPRGELMAGYDR